jgi:hypothetical protein
MNDPNEMTYGEVVDASPFDCTCPLPVCEFCGRCVLAGWCCNAAKEAAIKKQRECGEKGHVWEDNGLCGNCYAVKP